MGASGFPWLEAASVEPAFCKFPGSRGAAVNDGKVFGLAFWSCKGTSPVRSLASLHHMGILTLFRHERVTHKLAKNEAKKEKVTKKWYLNSYALLKCFGLYAPKRKEFYIKIVFILKEILKL